MVTSGASGGVAELARPTGTPLALFIGVAAAQPGPVALAGIQKPRPQRRIRLEAALPVLVQRLARLAVELITSQHLGGPNRILVQLDAQRRIALDGVFGDGPRRPGEW